MCEVAFSNFRSTTFLGHLSMLLDIKLSLCGKFIITADRDEKIRISHYPNAYNIHNFCLGHSDFVTSIELLPQQRTQLVSGSGDGTLKIWEFLKGAQITKNFYYKIFILGIEKHQKIYFVY